MELKFTQNNHMQIIEEFELNLYGIEMAFRRAMSCFQLMFELNLYGIEIRVRNFGVRKKNV